MGLTLVTAPPSKYDQAKPKSTNKPAPNISKSSSKSTADRARERLGTKDTTVRDRARDAFERMSSGNTRHDRVR